MAPLSFIYSPLGQHRVTVTIPELSRPLHLTSQSECLENIYLDSCGVYIIISSLYNYLLANTRQMVKRIRSLAYTDCTVAQNKQPS